MSRPEDRPSRAPGWSVRGHPTHPCLWVLLRSAMDIVDLVLKGLGQHKVFFDKPVEANVAPNYYQIISHPMDLGTIKKKLVDANNQGYSAEDFYRDMQLVWDNCRTFNRPTDAVAKAGVRGERAFKEHWNRLMVQAGPICLFVRPKPLAPAPHMGTRGAAKGPSCPPRVLAPTSVPPLAQPGSPAREAGDRQLPARRLHGGRKRALARAAAPGPVREDQGPQQHQQLLGGEGWATLMPASLSLAILLTPLSILLLQSELDELEAEVATRRPNVNTDFGAQLPPQRQNYATPKFPASAPPKRAAPAAAAPPPAAAMPAEPAGRRSMTQDQVQKLVDALGVIASMPEGDHYNNMIGIVKESGKLGYSADGEMEVDFGDLDAETLWKLHDFAKKVGVLQ